MTGEVHGPGYTLDELGDLMADWSWSAEQDADPSSEPWFASLLARDRDLLREFDMRWPKPWS